MNSFTTQTTTVGNEIWYVTLDYDENNLITIHLSETA